MIAEVNVNQDRKIIHRILTGEIDKTHAIRLVREIAFAVKCYGGYSILVDMRETAHHPQTADLLAIAEECTKQLDGFKSRIAFLIPDSEQRKQVARFFRTCMEAQSFELKHFFDYETAIAWLDDIPLGLRRHTA